MFILLNYASYNRSLILSFCRNEEEYEYIYSDEEEEEEEVEDFSYYNKECMEKDHLVEHVVQERGAQSFLHTRRTRTDQILVEETIDYEDDDHMIQDQQDVTFDTNDQLSFYSSPASDLGSSFDYDQVIVEDLGETDTDSDYSFRAIDHTIVYPTENHSGE